ncbi:unnamed protein product [Owenia fusiformis]|uniref:Uncharacterized protein n=1 Tax=Owenia fusiformis TaxID=6347 RepID=A0A8J1TGJ4_OWEFU|nr:unnamed protein product [Owenia fusiformis]
MSSSSGTEDNADCDSFAIIEDEPESIQLGETGSLCTLNMASLDSTHVNQTLKATNEGDTLVRDPDNGAPMSNGALASTGASASNDVIANNGETVSLQSDSLQTLTIKNNNDITVSVKPPPEKKEVYMEKPMIFIEQGPDGKLVVNDEAVKKLSKIEKPMVIMAIVGPYRTGKSYLANRLANAEKHSGFELGDTVQSKTKGIWIWAREHREDPEKCFLIIDTEGLHDGTNKGGGKNYENKIFAMSILLCSVFVFNTTSRIDQKAIDELDFITHITDYIEGQAPDPMDDTRDNEDFDPYISIRPKFAWVLRDFFLKCEMDGHVITSEEYMEKCLECKTIPRMANKRMKDELDDFNYPREQIKNMFPERTCFCMVTPISDQKLLANIDSVDEEKLEPAFLQEVQAFEDFIMYKCEPKYMMLGHKKVYITGKRLASLAETYVQTDTPNIQRAIDGITKRENEAVMDDIIACHHEHIEQNCSMPMEPNKLQEYITKQEEALIKEFGERKMNDKDLKYEKEMKDRIIKSKESILQTNEAIVKSECLRLLADSVEHYHDLIREECIFPVPQSDLQRANADTHKTIVQDFIKNTAFDSKQQFVEKLKSDLEREYKKLLERNEADDNRIRLKGKEKIDECCSHLVCSMKKERQDIGNEPIDDEDLRKVYDKCFDEEMKRFGEAVTFYGKEELQKNLKHKLDEERKKFEIMNKTARDHKKLLETEKRLAETAQNLKITTETSDKNKSELEMVNKQLMKTKKEGEQVKERLSEQNKKLDETVQKANELEKSNKNLEVNVQEECEKNKQMHLELNEKMKQLAETNDLFMNKTVELENTRKLVDTMGLLVENLEKSRGLFRLRLKGAPYILEAIAEDKVILSKIEAGKNSKGDLWKCDGLYIVNYEFQKVLDFNPREMQKGRTKLFLSEKEGGRVSQHWLLKSDQAFVRIKSKQRSKDKDLVLEGDCKFLTGTKFDKAAEKGVCVAERASIDFISESQKWACIIAHNISITQQTEDII